MNEWKKYAVGVVSKNPNFKEPKCYPFNFVGHVSHTTSAIEIARTGSIAAGLVFADSKLNKHRVLVSWFSPNMWHDGFRYGNVRFEVSFAKLFRAYPRSYWVESVPYNIHACRILLTKKDRSDLLAPYDPTVRTGPWWYDSEANKHYYNSTFCLEFMVEGNLSLTSAVKIHLVDHSANWCSQTPNEPHRCREIGLDRASAASILLARACNQPCHDDGITSLFKDEEGRANDMLKVAVRKINSLLPRNASVYEGDDFDLNSKQAVARALLNAHVLGKSDEVKGLAKLFADEDACLDALTRVIAHNIGLSKKEVSELFA